ncbi:isoaspartyl peptidase/L-asparaginase family protein [Bergeyella sp. RCAD1439]|uniref:isoaspartyl peptidase/L-asparaginase family protein n=1 Tax=Bergeyella anatis TaxID=3113737 RepID=UPI002E19ADC0|nr:isoaspartyl peptidase/L-asparaginase [Bergeyella sp. RCAD1439]
MRNLLMALAVFFSGLIGAQKKYVLVIHGGAGNITPENTTPQKETAYKTKLKEALLAGYSEIKKGKSAITAVESAIVLLEDSPLFNAGKGSVFTHDGLNEMDASIMDGKSLAAGAVAGVHTIKNPIKAAIAVMQNSPHVLLSGKGAEAFAKSQNLDLVTPRYFWTESQWLKHQNQRNQEKKQHKANPSLNLSSNKDQKFGTVGAVALDHNGNIAAGTSTGGMMNKKWNRIGDSPLIGAGTYANRQVGVSGTGWGEYFIRTTAARTLAAKMEYQGKDLVSATKETLALIEELGGNGGLIALDRHGNIAMEMNTAGMYRGAITEDGEIEIYLYN